MQKSRHFTMPGWICFIMFLGLVNPGCDRCKEKATFKLCERILSARDIVFIMDQSGTMYANDPLALRWEAVQELITTTLHEEKKSLSGTQITRFAIIPFGSLEETKKYNKEIKWFDHTGIDMLAKILANWRKTPEKQAAKLSDFYAPFSVLVDKLNWRMGAERYIIFLTDGRYNVEINDNIPKFRIKEENQFNQFIHSLNQRKDEWPIYFIGMGLPGFDKTRKELNVNINRLARMAGAIPLPEYIINTIRPPAFSEPTPIAHNLLTLISSDPFEIQRRLRSQLANILHGARYVQAELTTDSTALFPLTRPDLVEIEILTKKEITTERLAENLKLFIKPKKGDLFLDPLQLIYPGNGTPPDRIHTFKVDTVALSHKIPDWKKLTSIRSWGLLSNSSVSMIEVNLIIKDNWSVKVDSCYIKKIPKSRGLWQRYWHKRTQPSYQLVLNAHASHPCGSQLPCGQLKIGIGEKKIAEVDTVKFETRRYSDSDNVQEHIYYWEADIKNWKEFEKNIGLTIPITIEVEDLYACRLQVSVEVPPNAREIPDNLLHK